MNNVNKFILKIPTRKGKHGVFGIPQSNQYHSISNVTYSHIPFLTADEIWKNQIAIFTLNDVDDFVSIHFQSTQSSLKKNVSSQYRLDDYPTFHKSSHRFIDGNNKRIKNISRKIIGNNTRLNKISENVYDYVLTNLTYGNPIDGLYSYRDVIKNTTTDCGGFSTYLLSIFQSVGIPGRLVIGFIINDRIIDKMLSIFNFSFLNFDSLLMHAWCEIQLPDKSWFPMDPSIEWRRKHNYTSRQGGYGDIPNDRLVTSYGEDIQMNFLNKDFKFDILQKPIYFSL